MAFPTRARSPLAQTVRERLGDRACPLCGERAWDFEGLRVVFLVDASDGSRLADYRRFAAAGPVLSWGRTNESDAEKAQRWTGDQLKPVRTAASRNRLVQLTCNNCGHTELLDAEKVGA